MVKPLVVSRTGLSDGLSQARHLRISFIVLRLLPEARSRLDEVPFECVKTMLDALFIAFSTAEVTSSTGGSWVLKKLPFSSSSSFFFSSLPRFSTFSNVDSLRGLLIYSFTLTSCLFFPFFLSFFLSYLPSSHRLIDPSFHWHGLHECSPGSSSSSCIHSIYSVQLLIMTFLHLSMGSKLGAHDNPTSFALCDFLVPQAR